MKNFVRSTLTLALALGLAVPPAFASPADYAAALARFRDVKSGKIRSVAALKSVAPAVTPAVTPTVAPPAVAPVAAKSAPAAPESPAVAPAKAKPAAKTAGPALTGPVAALLAPSTGTAAPGAKLTLGDAVRLAIETNYGVRFQKVAVSVAKIDIVDVARRYLPKLDFSLVQTHMDQASSIKFGGAALKMSDQDPQSYKFDLSWPIYLFGKLKNAMLAATKNVEANEQALDSNVVNTAFQVKQAFLGMLLAEQFVHIAELSLEQIDNHVKTVQSQFEVGMASKFDLLRIEVQKANTKPQLIRAHLALKNARDGFNMLLGRPIDTPFEITGELKAAGTMPVDLEKWTATALEARQDLKKARKELEAARAGFEEARRGRNPNFVLTSGYSRVHGQSTTSLNNWDESWNANAVLQLPLLNQRETETAVKKARENIRRAELQIEMVENQVRLDVKQAVNELIQASELLAASEKNIEQADEALNIADVSYENGLNTNLEVMDAQLAVVQSRTNYSQATYDWLIARAKLDKALGALGEL